MMAGVWPPEILIVYGLQIQLFLNQTPKYVWNCYEAFNFSVKLSAPSKQLTYP